MNTNLEKWSTNRFSRIRCFLNQRLLKTLNKLLFFLLSDPTKAGLHILLNICARISLLQLDLCLDPDYVQKVQRTRRGLQDGSSLWEGLQVWRGMGKVETLRHTPSSISAPFLFPFPFPINQVLITLRVVSRNLLASTLGPIRRNPHPGCLCLDCHTPDLPKLDKILRTCCTPSCTNEICQQIYW